MKGKKITFIGAGSINFTRRLLRDMLSVKELQNFQIAFHDIDPRNLDAVTRICQREIDANGLSIKIEASEDRAQALTGSDYVVNAARIGGLEAYESDIVIPLKYGVDQCVGDTVCVGGIMYGQRGISFMLDVCRDIKRYSKPDCILFNYGNPNAMLTWACNKYGGVNTYGMCHGVHYSHVLLADIFGLEKDDVDIIAAGINHMTWFISVKHKGVQLADQVLEKIQAHPKYSVEEKCRIDVLKRFGYFSTESNGHLSEYLPWYRSRPDEIEKYIAHQRWILGETGGYLRYSRETREWFDREVPNMLKEKPVKFERDFKDMEHLSFILEGLNTGRVYRGHFNVVNNAVITNLSPDAIVEVPCYVDYNGISVPRVGDLPIACAALCESNISVQRLSVEAAVHGDIDMLRRAMLIDPLTAAVCSPDEVFQVTDEMLIAQEKWLPQYKKAVAEAKLRIKKSKADGTYIVSKRCLKGRMK